MFKGRGTCVLRCECFTGGYNPLFAQFWAVCGTSSLLRSFQPHSNSVRWVPLFLVFTDEDTDAQIGFMGSVMSYFNLDTPAAKKNLTMLPISQASKD